MSSKSELAEQVQEPEEYTGQSWADLMAGEKDTILGYDPAKDELLDALVGVPHLITSMTFRPGVTRKTGNGDKKFAYVSLEAIVPPETELDLAKINAARKTSKLEPVANLTDLPFGANDHVVYNDGSTGIYRQVVQYLGAKGYVSLVKEGEEVVTNGKLGETTYDLPPEDWADIHTGHMRFDTDGFGLYSVHVRLFCPRGLRLSKYENEYNPDGSKTRYLA